MSVILWLLIIASFIAAFVGLVKPIIPAVLMLWVGFLIYQFGFHNGQLSWIFYVSMAILTVSIFASNLLLNSYFVKRYGGSRAGEAAATLGLVVGCFVIPPFGVIVVPLVAVFIVEFMQSRHLKRAFMTSASSIIAFLASAAAQAVIMFIMIIFFFVDALWLN